MRMRSTLLCSAIVVLLLIYHQLVTFFDFLRISQKMSPTDGRPIRKRIPHDSQTALTLAVFGGSISRARNVPQNKSYSDLLADRFPSIQIINMAIPASGPRYYIECGTDSYDIIISEFRLNEGDPATLHTWYNHTRMCARHTIILELWSFLNPPLPSQSQTIISAQEGGFLDMKNSDSNATNSRFSVLSLTERDALSWRENLPNYFNYSATKNPIPSECYSSVWERNSSEESTMKFCRQHHANEMNHGMEPFHQNVADSLAKHLESVVLPLVSSQQYDDRFQQNWARDRECYGSWGQIPFFMPGEVGDANTYFKPGEVGDWRRVLIGESGFQFGPNPLSGRLDKSSLYTNSLNASLTLACPEQYPFLKFGFIAHSDERERAKFFANDVEVDTWLRGDKRPGVRIRIISDATKSPLRIVPVEINSGAYIEVTNLFCFMSKTSTRWGSPGGD